MNNLKGISRTLLKEFENINEDEISNDRKGKKKESDNSDEEEYQPSILKRDYETRNKNKNSTRGNLKQEQETFKAAMKPRQENSLGELTKKFINMIKRSEDLWVDLNDVVKELNVQK